MLLSYVEDCARGALRSGELSPDFIVLNGIRAGILDGEVIFVVFEFIEEAMGLRRMVDTGVFAAGLGGAFMTLPWRDGGADFTDFVDGGNAEGVFDRGGGGAFAAAASISSR